jgi:hypothetical protein
LFLTSLTQSLSSQQLLTAEKEPTTASTVELASIVEPVVRFESKAFSTLMSLESGMGLQVDPPKKLQESRDCLCLKATYFAFKKRLLPTFALLLPEGSLSEAQSLASNTA